MLPTKLTKESASLSSIPRQLPLAPAVALLPLGIAERRIIRAVQRAHHCRSRELHPSDLALGCVRQAIGGMLPTLFFLDLWRQRQDVLCCVFRVRSFRPSGRSIR